MASIYIVLEIYKYMRFGNKRKYNTIQEVQYNTMGVRRSLVVTFAAIRLQGPRFKPRPGQKFETRFLFPAHPCSATGTTTSGTRASSKPANSPKKWASEGSTDGCWYISRKEETRMKFNGRRRRVNGKNTEIWKAKGKAVDINICEVKTQDTRASHNSLELT